MYPGAVGGSNPREEQLQELFDRRRECTARNADRSVFDFGLNIRRGSRADIVAVRFTLPPAFPLVPPQATVLTEGVKHAWLDARGNITGCPSLYGWNSRSRLYQVVTDVINKFVMDPPQILDAGAFSNNRSSGNYSQAGSVGGPGINSQQANRPKSTSSAGAGGNDENDGMIFLPRVPEKFPELESLTLEELKKLLNNSDDFEAFFLELPTTKTIIEMRDEIKRNNEKQARSNISYRGRIEELQKQLIATQEEANQDWKQLKALEERQNVALRQFDPLRLLMNLETSCNKIDDESENVASDYLNGNIQLAEFLNREMELRKLYHIRKAKAELFRNQLKKK